MCRCYENNVISYCNCAQRGFMRGNQPRWWSGTTTPLFHPLSAPLSLFCYPLRPFVTRAFLHSAQRIMERSSILAIPLSFRKRTSESRFFSGHSLARNFYHAVPALINGAGLHERSRDLSDGTTFHRFCPLILGLFN